MIIDVLASSSLGNAYIVSDCYSSILLEAGISYRELQTKSNFKVNDVVACFVTHSHLDHSKAIKDLAKAAIDVYAPTETFEALKLSGHRLHGLNENDVVEVGTFKVKALKMHHDCICFGYMVLSTITGEKLFFATDTYKITVNPAKVDYMILEINYQMEIVNRLVNEGVMETSIRHRLMNSHFELSNALKWLTRIDKSNLKRIYVAHLSSGNANAEEIKRAVIEAMGVPVTICEA